MAATIAAFIKPLGCQRKVLRKMGNNFPEKTQGLVREGIYSTNLESIMAAIHDEIGMEKLGQFGKDGERSVEDGVNPKLRTPHSALRTPNSALQNLLNA